MRPESGRFSSKELLSADGGLFMANLTTADISDSAGAQMILGSVRKRWPWLKHRFADGAYDRTTLMDKAAFLDFSIEIVRRPDTAEGFDVIRAAGLSSALSPG